MVIKCPCCVSGHADGMFGATCFHCRGSGQYRVPPEDILQTDVQSTQRLSKAIDVITRVADPSDEGFNGLCHEYSSCRHRQQAAAAVLPVLQRYLVGIKTVPLTLVCLDFEAMARIATEVMGLSGPDVPHFVGKRFQDVIDYINEVQPNHVLLADVDMVAQLEPDSKVFTIQEVQMVINMMTAPKKEGG